MSERYADVEIRILDTHDPGFPVEMTLNGEQEFSAGYLDPATLPELQIVSPVQASERLTAWFFGHDALKRAWNRMRGHAPKCRIRLRVDPSRLRLLPWELLREERNLLSAQAGTPFSRYLPVDLAWDDAVQVRPIRILIVISNPSDLQARYDLPPVDVKLEQELLNSVFSGLDEYQLTVDFLGAPVTPDGVEQALQDDYHLVHFIAHGEYNETRGQAALYLQDNAGRARRVSDSELANMISRQRTQPRLVMLAVCQSAVPSTADAFAGLAPRLVAAGVPAVVAMQDVVTVETARRFGLAFYRRLLACGYVDQAANEARSTLLTAGRPDAAVPVLFSRLRDNQLLIPLTDKPISPVERKPFEPETVYIPAGPFLMGSRAGEGVPDDQVPQFEVDLPAYWIAKYPVTNEQYAEFVRQTGRVVAPEAGWQGQRPPADELDHPVSGVTWYDALAYCEWLREYSGRQYMLSSEAQWEKAARGVDGRIYPWGNDWSANRCNHGNARSAPVDAYPDGVSSFGCYDMVGNVREWTRTVWGEKLRTPDPGFDYPWVNDHRENLMASRYLLRVYRGGSSADSKEKLRCSARGAFFPDRPGPRHRRHGFRIVLMI